MRGLVPSSAHIHNSLEPERPDTKAIFFPSGDTAGVTSIRVELTTGIGGLSLCHTVPSGPAISVSHICRWWPSIRLSVMFLRLSLFQLPNRLAGPLPHVAFGS
ncbi:MAG: hypothetical protein ACRD9L_09055, partial [Bryobacteraceae bacterium]